MIWIVLQFVSYRFVKSLKTVRESDHHCRQIPRSLKEARVLIYKFDFQADDLRILENLKKLIGYLRNDNWPRKSEREQIATVWTPNWIFGVHFPWMLLFSEPTSLYPLGMPANLIQIDMRIRERKICIRIPIEHFQAARCLTVWPCVHSMKLFKVSNWNFRIERENLKLQRVLRYSKVSLSKQCWGIDTFEDIWQCRGISLQRYISLLGFLICLKRGASIWMLITVNPWIIQRRTRL